MPGHRRTPGPCRRSAPAVPAAHQHGTVLVVPVGVQEDLALVADGLQGPVGFRQVEGIRQADCHRVPALPEDDTDLGRRANRARLCPEQGRQLRLARRDESQPSTAGANPGLQPLRGLHRELGATHDHVDVIEVGGMPLSTSTRT